MSRKRIVVMGFMAGCPIAGVVWQHIHYIVGLQRLGHEVFYIEDSARLPYDPVTFEITNDYTYAVQNLSRLANQFGFQHRWAFCARYLPEEPCIGLSIPKVRELYHTADAILNICGTQEMNHDLEANRNILYIESDPGVEQILVDKRDPKPIDYLSRHAKLFTFGENIGRPECPIPTHQFQWHPTRQPIVTDFWKTDHPPAPDALFTTIANWNTSDLKDIEWRGDKYLWSKSLEFLRFIEAPARSGEPFEIGTTIRDPAISQRFRESGWHLTNPDRISLEHDDYVACIRASKGEFTVAKDQYTRLHTGWFSDRSACYLAAGRPVITQQTGFTRLYGGKQGLLAFTTLEEIVEHVRAINADYPAHSRAAYEIAAEYFEAEKVVGSLLERAGV